jgi:non-heme chloroperoxidase
MRVWRIISPLLLISVLLLPLNIAAQEIAPWHDPSPHTIQFVTAAKDVKLEVLDWGGSGRPIVFLAGFGNTAHVFDDFAPKLTAEYHVYGITRRGFGASSAPVPDATNYSADRLGDDVLAVLDALKLERPVLVGHSIAGEELSSVGTRHPDRIAGLIYLESGYEYAYYDASLGNEDIDSKELLKKLEELKAARENLGGDEGQVIQDLLKVNLPQFEKDLRERQTELTSASWPTPPPPTDADRENFDTWRSRQKRVAGVSMPESEERQTHQSTPEGHVDHAHTNPALAQAFMAGEQKYTDIRVPVLAIYAVPRDYGPFVNDNPAVRDAIEKAETPLTEAHAKAFERGVPSAHVIRLPHANHYIFMSNEADVLREVRTFLAGLN